MTTRSRKPRWSATLRRVSLACLGLASAVGVTRGQPSPTTIGVEVNVRDSSLVTERLDMADRMIAAAEWGKAADLLQELVDQQSGRVVAVRRDPSSNPTLYVGADRAAWERISSWPAEGLAVYRNRFEPAAAAMLESANDDPAALNRLVRRYAPTLAAREAAIRLIDASLADGEFAAATWTANALLPWIDKSDPAVAGVLVRKLAAAVLSGDASSAAAIAGEIRNQHADTPVRFKGVDVPANGVAASLLAEQPAVAAGLNENWPTLGGSPSRAGVSDAVGRAGARIYSIELPGPSYNDISAAQRQALEQGVDLSDETSGAGTGIIPVADRGAIFFHDGQRLQGVSLDSGAPLSGWADTYPGERRGQFTVNAWGWPRGQQLTTTVAGDAVLAVMGQSDRIARQFVADPPPGQLVCLDRVSGRVRWSVSPTTLPEEPLRQVQFSGSPLAVDGRVYVMGRTSRQGAFADCYVHCFSLADGSHLWSTYVAGGQTYVPAFSELMNTQDNASHPAAGGGRVFVASDVGAMASLDATTGSIVWLHAYERDGRERMAQEGFGGRAFRMNAVGPDASVGLGKPWAVNPVILDRGRVFVLPSDGSHLMVYDAGTGNVLKRLSLSVLGKPDTLLGVWGRLLVLTGDTARGNRTGFLQLVDWETFEDVEEADPKRIDPSVVFRREFGTPIRGRGFIAGDHAYIPTRERLFCLNLVDRRVVDSGTYPPYARGGWGPTKDEDSAAEGPGNVLVAGDYVVIAGPRRLDVYTDIDVARGKLDTAISASPNDPDPRLRYAALMYAAGDYPSTLARLDEAAERMAPASNASPADATGAAAAGAIATGVNATGGNVASISAEEVASAQGRLFIDSLTYARRLMPQITPKKPDPQFQSVIDGFFDRSANAARTPAQQVEYRLTRAEAYRLLGQPTLQVALYQQILTDPVLRAVPTASGDPTAAFAEQAIGQVIRDSGLQVYVEIDAAATAAFDAAVASGDAQALLEVARAYPNSRPAPGALQAAAERFEADGDPRAAIRALRQLSIRFPRGAVRGGTAEAIARNYLRLPGGIDAAIGRLTLADLPVTTPLSHPMTLPDGTPLMAQTVGDAVAELSAVRRSLEWDALPDFRLPPLQRKGPGGRRVLVEPFLPERTIIDGIDDLPALRPGHARYDRIVAKAAGNVLQVYEVGKATPNYERRLSDGDRDGGQSIAAAWQGERLLAWDQTHLWAMRPDAGDDGWKIELPKLPEPETIAEPRPLPPQRNAGMPELNRVNRRVAVGFPRPIRPAQPPAATDEPESLAEVIPLSDRVIASTTGGRVFAASLLDGTILWQYRQAGPRVQQIVAGEDFAVLMLDSDDSRQLVALDSDTGRTVNRAAFAQGMPQPINMALSRDGTLVYTLPDRVQVVDLYEPWSPKGESPPEGSLQLFAQMAGPRQLLAVDGLVLAVSNEVQMAGRDVASPFIRIYSLVDGKQRGSPMSTGAATTDVTLQAAAGYVYSISPKAVRAFAMDGSDRPETQQRSLDPSATVAEAFVGRDYLILTDTVGNIGQAPVNFWRLWAYSRAPTPSGESGMIDHNPTIQNEHGIKQWRPANGGLYALSADGKLQFFRGARP